MVLLLDLLKQQKSGYTLGQRSCPEQGGTRVFSGDSFLESSVSGPSISHPVSSPNLGKNDTSV